MSEIEYLRLLRKVLDHGEERQDRTGVGTYSLFGERLQFDLVEGFPILTTKRVWFKGVAAELLWFLRADMDTKFLHEHGVKIWDANAFGGGFVGPIYGSLWRMWPNPNDGVNPIIDQLAEVIEEIKTNPSSRRLLVSAWNPAEIPYACLPPCHYAFQFYVRWGKLLDCQMHMRSADMFLGVPFNIASYALLTSMVAQVTDLTPGRLTITLGDTHVYTNHFSQVEEQLTRMPLDPPTLWLNPNIKDIDGFTLDDIKLQNYRHAAAIEAPMAV